MSITMTMIMTMNMIMIMMIVIMIIDNEYGAKHSPPGHQGAPNCPEGGPLLGSLEISLSHQNFPGISLIQEISTALIIIFNVLSDDQSLVSV